jgi:hypothetical protein
LARLSGHVGASFTMIQTVPIYDLDEAVWTLYDWDDAGYEDGDPLNDEEKGAFYFTLRSQGNDTYPVITHDDIEVQAYRLPFVMANTHDASLTFIPRDQMRGKMFDYILEFVKTDAPVLVAQGEFFTN